MENDEPIVDDNVPRYIKLDASGPWNWKVVGAYIAYGALTTAAAFFFGNLIEKRTVRHVNAALLSDWNETHGVKSEDEA